MQDSAQLSLVPESQERQLATQPLQTLGSPMPVAQMLQAAIDKGVTADNVAAVEKLVDLYERMQDKAAEQQFAAAFVALQSEMPRIEAIKPVPNRDGSVRFKYAPYEEIMEKVRPLLQKHGFTVTFSSEVRENRVVQTCTLQHVGGHKRSNQSMARIGNGPPGSSDAQADGAASTYAKRQAFCDALNIVVEHDSDAAPQDARNEGAPISREQVQYLKEQLHETGSNEAAFLKLAGVGRIEEIGSSSYSVLVRMLEQKKARK
jgi:hypothetical protein